jgi:hypothetical protein
MPTTNVEPNADVALGGIPTGRLPATPRDQLLAGMPVSFAIVETKEDRVLDASWLAEAARLGVAVDISHAVFRGPVSLRATQFTKDVRIVDSEFEESVDFAYADFARTVQFSGTRFDRGATFDSARFRSDVSFARTHFDSGANGNKEIVFNDAEFVGVLDARQIRFEASAVASFTRVRFRSAAYFIEAHFGGSADFSHAQADGALDFGDARLQGTFNGSYLRVGHYLNFTRARLKHTAEWLSLRESQLTGSLYCDEARFEAMIDLSESRIHPALHASNACFLGFVRLSAAALGAASFVAARFGRRSSVLFDGLGVGGRFDLSRAVLKRDADFSDLAAGSNVMIAQARLLGHTKMVRARIKGLVDLSGSVCTSLDLTNAHVDGGITAHGTVFRGPMVARNAQLGEFIFNGTAEGHVSLYSARLSGALVLAGAHFRARPESLDLAGVCVGTQAFLDGACFRGKLNAIGLKVEQQLSFRKVICGGEVDFYEVSIGRGCFFWQARFRGPFKFDSGSVSGELHLSGARFRAWASFTGTTIHRLLMFPDPEHGGEATRFRGELSLTHARIGNLVCNGVQCTSTAASARFGHMVVTGISTFSDAVFAGNVSFYSSSFGGQAFFERAGFLGDHAVDFRGAIFQSNVFFKPVMFLSGVDFTSARFDELACFRGFVEGIGTFDMCRFRGMADFSDPGSADTTWTFEIPSRMSADPSTAGTRFQAASFAHAEITGDARFENAAFGSGLNLRDSVVSSLFLPADPEHADQLLPKRIDLRGCSYEQMSVCLTSLFRADAKRERLSPYDRRAYLTLEQKLRASGDDAGANRVHLAWRRAERRRFFKEGSFGLWLFSWLYRIVANYGIRPYRLAVASALLLVAGTYYFAQPGTVVPEEASRRTSEAYRPTRNEAIGVSLRQFLPVGVPLAEHLVPAQTEIPVRLRWRDYGTTVQTTPAVWATLLTLLGWILVPLGLGSITGVLRRLPQQ